MKTTFQRIYTDDQLELHGLLYEPETSTDIVLVHVHGMAGNFYENKFLDAIAKELTGNRIAFATFNNRGCEFYKDLIKIEGEESKIVRIGDTFERFEDCLIDIKSYIDFLADKGFKKIHLSGHSLGSPKVAYYAAESGDKRLSSVLLLSPSDMLGLVRGNQGRFQEDISLATKMVSEGKEKEIMPRLIWDEYPLSAGTYVSLFADDSKAGIFNFFNPEDKFETLSKITVPVFAVMGKKDDSLVIPIEETMNKIESSVSSAPKCETVILGDANHGYRGDEENLAVAINGWLLAL